MTIENQQTIDAIIREMNEILSFGKRAENTLTAYRTYVYPFLEYCFEELDKSPYEATEKDVRSFIIAIQADRDLGDRTVNLIISSIHNLFQSVLDIPWNKYKIPFRSFDEFIPFVPAKEELETFISSTQDLKRKAIFAIMFAAGLRVSEACSLHCGDIVMSKKAVRVRPSKRRKERYIGLPDNCFDVIMKYYYSLPYESRRRLTTGSWLFPMKSDPERPVYTNFIIDYIPKAERSLGWEHRLSSHSFRRAFATHNYLDGNMTMEEIQSALGHRNISTTRIYVRQGIAALWPRHPNSIDGMSL